MKTIIFDYSTKSTELLLKEFAVNTQKGLSCDSVAKQHRLFGLNKLRLHSVSIWRIFARQFHSAFIYLLLGALIITLSLGEKTDSLLIFIFLMVNALLGFFQEYHSEKTIALLNKYTLPRAHVLRDGKHHKIISEQLLPGDIIFLTAGDKITADIRILEQTGLVVDETVLTGESISVYKTADKLEKAPTNYNEASNIGFSGTIVQKGTAMALVVATGKNTVFGTIATLTTESKKISDFEKGISRFSKFILKLVGLTLVLIVLANVFVKGDKLNLFELMIFSIALTISVIPEALPLVTTFSLAQGARKLTKENVIVKRLSAIEDLGGIEILCSDKTGTLTENKLTVANIYSNQPGQTLLFAAVASASSVGEKTEPFDIALENELNHKQKQALQNASIISEEPFTPTTKRNIVLTTLEGKTLLITRGAPEEVLKQCPDVKKQDKANIQEWIAREGEQGHRVLAIAYKADISINQNKTTLQVLESDNYTFLGIVSFVDPIKPSAVRAVIKAKELCVAVKIITGDSLEVAGTVGQKIGLINSPTEVLCGEDWEKMKTEDQCTALNNYSIFARVSPEQKFKIIEALNKHYVVGFLGEGINDAPALKIATVSIVVDSAADIAREAADIILMRKNLEVILDGIKKGREVFANTTKYLKATLASNFGNFFAIAIASLLIDYLPMLPIQILLLNLLSDTPMISISTDNVNQDELKAPQKYKVNEIVLLAIFLSVISTTFDFIFFSLFVHISPGVLQTNWFIGSVLTELALVFSIRTKSFFLKGTKPSKYIICLSIAIILVTVGLPYTAIGQNVFKFVPPTLSQLGLIFSIVIIYFICSETIKLLYYYYMTTVRKNKLCKNGKNLPQT